MMICVCVGVLPMMTVQVSSVHKMEADFGWPLWVFGIQTYHVFSTGQILALYQDPKVRMSSAVVVTIPLCIMQLLECIMPHVSPCIQSLHMYL